MSRFCNHLMAELIGPVWRHQDSPKDSSFAMQEDVASERPIDQAQRETEESLCKRDLLTGRDLLPGNGECDNFPKHDDFNGCGSQPDIKDVAVKELHADKPNRRRQKDNHEKLN